MVRENNQAGGYTYVWTYDDAGNILTRTEYACTLGTLGTPLATVNYGYSQDGWGDLLTSYNGTAVEFDGAWYYTWEHGHQLSTMISEDWETEWTFSYNADGLRTKRTNGAKTYTYLYNNGLLTQMIVGGNTLRFAYDAVGAPLTVTLNGTVYFYVTNLQGDVIGIRMVEGAEIVGYTYDAWGNVLHVSGTHALATLNPLRYRGYIYDTETCLYYLQSRYYNPQWGRFISADKYLSTGQGILGHNIFAYCLNNPINGVDSSGQFSIWVIGAILGGIVLGAILGYNSDDKLWENSNNQDKITNNESQDESSKAEQTEDTSSTQSELTTFDKIKNALIGASIGLGTGGLAVAFGGAVGVVAVGSATTTIGFFGATGARTVALGLAIYDIWATVGAPFLGLELEPIELVP